MRRRRVGILLIVLGVVLAAVVGGGVYVLAQQATTTEAEETAKVVVVVAPIGERTLIPQTSIGLVDVPLRLIPTAALRRIEDAAGKMALDDMFPGDWVLSNRIADTKGQSGLSFTLEATNVVLTFPPSDIVQTGAIRPGDHVDVFVTIDTAKESPTALPPGVTASPGGVTQMTIQNLKVLAIGSVANTMRTAQAAPAAGAPQPTQAGPQQITFSVPRDDALTLKQIKDYPGAKIEMVLRPAGDEQIYTTEAVNMRSLIERYKITAP